MTLPQTHLQLLSQLRADGYAAADLARVNGAYWLAAEAFSGRLRGTGKPFLCHLVGTAAAAALERPPLHVVTAALCHGIHRTGDFGRLDQQARMRLLSQRLGDETLALLQFYGAFQAGRSRTITALLAKPLADVTAQERSAALIWIANEVDDYADAGPRFRQPRPDNNRRKSFSLQLAEKFGWARLRSALQHGYDVFDHADWAAALAALRTGSLNIVRRTPEPRMMKLRQLYWRLCTRSRKKR